MMNVLGNLFEAPGHSEDEEIVESLLNVEGCRLERIVSTGQHTPDGEWLDQDFDEWVVMLTGKAQLRFKEPNEIVDLNPGDYLNIAAHRRHRVEWTDPSEATIWLATHYNVVGSS